MGEAVSSQTVPYKLIFLDIDGVLNSFWTAGQLNSVLVEGLATMVKATGAVIVLSSMWRLKHKHRQRVVSAFLVHGIPLFISCTPHLQYAHHDWRYARVQEILCWLQMNTTLHFREQDMVSQYDIAPDVEGQFERQHYMLPLRINVSHVVALDDIDMRVEGGPARHLIARHHFVMTVMSTGLTRHNIKQAEYILSPQYRPIDMWLPGGRAADRDETTNDMSAILLPYRDLCEQCEAKKAEHYDMAINKYFCEPACRDQFYSIHFPSPDGASHISTQ